MTNMKTDGFLETIFVIKSLNLLIISHPHMHK